MEDNMNFFNQKQDAVIYNIFIKSSLYNDIVEYSGSAQSRTMLPLQSGRH